MNSIADLRTLKAEKLRRIYARDPELYAEQVLGVCWWAKQREIARALLTHRQVFVRASHMVGKTMVAGGLVNWFFDCFVPGITLTTAPNKVSVVDNLWKEVRVQRRGRPGLQPRAPRMETAPNHFAVGMTARSGTAFQGRHESNVAIVFDEAVDIAGEFWDAAKGMLSENSPWLAIMNPTTTACRAYEEESDPAGHWHSITISALEHPNIAAELAGLPPPFPAAVRLRWIRDRIAEWCDPIDPADRRSGDIEFPPGGGTWHRPGPLAEGKLLGRWPTQGTNAVWSESMWNAAGVQVPIPKEPLHLGCDVAREGNDFTSILARRGPCAIHHETHNGWKTDRTAGRLKELAGSLAELGEDPEKVPIKIDDDGVGGGVVDQGGDYNFQPVNAQTVAFEPERYDKRRSELWFAVAERADTGMLDLSRLSQESRRLIRKQVMAPVWSLDGKGRRCVERKEKTKAQCGRSPDDADAMNLAYAPAREMGKAMTVHTPRRKRIIMGVEI